MKKKKLKQHNIKMMKVCEECGKLCHRKDATENDPFVEEIFGVKKPKVLCPECAWEYVLDT